MCCAHHLHNLQRLSSLIIFYACAEPCFCLQPAYILLKVVAGALKKALDDIQDGLGCAKLTMSAQQEISMDDPEDQETAFC